MPEAKQRSERLIGVLIVGLLALNYPLLSLFSRERLLFGVPLLYLYLFAVWSFFIVCVALTLTRPSSPAAPTDRSPSQPSE